MLRRLLLAIAILTPGPAAAQLAEVDAALVLVVDVSWSIDDADYALLRDGMAAAFRSPAVVRAVQDGPRGAVAVTVVQSAKDGDQVIGVPWARVSDAASAALLAQRIATMPRRVDGGATAIGAAVDFARELLAACPCAPDRRVIDYAGDGRNNRSRLGAARDGADAAGITVNGLAILAEVPTLREYFELRLIAGPDAFAEAAETIADFPPAFRRKLIRELGGMAAASPRTRRPRRRRGLGDLRGGGACPVGRPNPPGFALCPTPASPVAPAADTVRAAYRRSRRKLHLTETPSGTVSPAITSWLHRRRSPPPK